MLSIFGEIESLFQIRVKIMGEEVSEDRTKVAEKKN